MEIFSRVTANILFLTMEIFSRVTANILFFFLQRRSIDNSASSLVLNNIDLCTENSSSSLVLNDLCIENSSSSLVLNNIDLLNEILLRLPVKSLVVLKYVSKQWLSLISSPRFMQNHWIHNYKLSASRIYFPNKVYRAPITSYDLVLVDERMVINEGVTLEITQDGEPLRLIIEQSRNGLLLCSDSDEYYIYNPSTKHYKSLPHDPFGSRGYSYSLVYDPLKSLNYEVICFGNFGDSEPSKKKNFGDSDDDIVDLYESAIYSSVTNSWRLSRDVYAPDCTMCSPGVPWDGCLHWVNLRNNTYIYFNIGREEFITLPLSNEMHDKDYVYFDEWMDHLHLIVSDQALPYCWDVFELEINHRNWKPICRINVDESRREYFPSIFRKYSLQVVESICRMNINKLSGYHRAAADDILINFIVLQVVSEGDGEMGDLRAIIHLKDNTIISYDLKKNTFKVICKYKKFYTLKTHAHIESLADVF